MEQESLNNRSQKLLRLLVECYINEGQPVGSKTLADKVDLPISPATVRNIVSDLEACGFVDSPHTSAGRVPTSRGYRFFVDQLLSTQLAVDFDDQELVNKLPKSDAKGLVVAASSLLANMTKLTSLVMLPRYDRAILRDIEFLPLSDHRVLVILVLDNSEVQNRIIHTERGYSDRELKEIGNFLTQKFAGKELTTIRDALTSEINQKRCDIVSLTQTLVEMTNKVLGEDGDYVVSGESNLFKAGDYADIGRLKDLIAVFTERREILYILNQCLSADGVKIYIGEESGCKLLDDCSIITKPYHRHGKIVGVLGIIGPTRMHYDQAIAAVDLTAKILSSALMESE